MSKGISLEKILSELPVNFILKIKKNADFFRGGARAEQYINAHLPVVVMTVIVIFLSAPSGV